MDRNVITEADVANDPTKEVDTARERLLKFVPIEAVGAYTAIEAGFKTAQDGGRKVDDAIVWFVVVALAIFTIAYLRKFQNVRRVSQIAVSTAAFGVYTLTAGGLFATQVTRIDPLWQLILLVLTGLALLFFKPPKAVPET